MSENPQLEESYNELCSLIAKTTDEKFLKDFFSCLFTQTERSDFAMRWLLVKEIKAFDDKIEITFNSPLRTGPDNQGLSFLPKLKQVKYLSVGRSKPIIMNVKLEICV
mgnify:CR=1 FL=1